MNAADKQFSELACEPQKQASASSRGDHERTPLARGRYRVGQPFEALGVPAAA
jgi:hypothetical protein